MGRKPAETHRQRVGLTLDPAIISTLNRIAADLNVHRNLVIEEAVVRAFKVSGITPFGDVLLERGVKSLEAAE